MTKARWNCYHNPCCRKGAADCWKCDMFRPMTYDPPEELPRQQPVYWEPDPNLPDATVACIEGRLDQLQGQAKYLQAKLQQHVSASIRRKRSEGF